jgi:hypothetical protein
MKKNTLYYKKETARKMMNFHGKLLAWSLVIAVFIVIIATLS